MIIFHPNVTKYHMMYTTICSHISQKYSKNCVECSSLSMKIIEFYYNLMVLLCIFVCPNGVQVRKERKFQKKNENISNMYTRVGILYFTQNKKTLRVGISSSGTVNGFFRISKTQNSSIDLNIESYVSVISLYDLDTVSPVRVEIWRQNIFSFFYAYDFVELSFIFVFILWYFYPPLTHFSNKKVDHNYIVYDIY